MAAFFGAVIRFGFDNPGAQPQAVDPMADDFAQQFARDKLGVAVEKGVREHRWHRQRGHKMAEKLQIIATRA